MLLALLVLFAVLLTASTVLLHEARTGRLQGPTPRATAVRAGLFLGATVAGASLLIALAGGEWVPFFALLPITLLCLFRWAQLARTWWTGWALPLVTCTLIGLGLLACLPLLPTPLDRNVLLEQIRDAGPLPSIQPDAGRPVRA